MAKFVVDSHPERANAATENSPEAWQGSLLASGDYSLSHQPLETIAEELAAAKVIYQESGTAMFVEDAGRCEIVPLFIPRGGKIVFDDEVRSRFLHNNIWWVDWNQTAYRHNPFERPLNEVYSIGAEDPRVVVYNFGSSLQPEDEQALVGTYNWFAANVTPSIFAYAPKIVIGKHLPFFYQETPPRPTFGMYDGGTNMVSLADFNLHGLRGVPEIKRYEPLLNRGASLLEIIATHELAHAVMHYGSLQLVNFEEMAGWEEVRYKTKGKNGPRSWEVSGLGLDHKGLPVSDYGFRNSMEDIAEMFTFYRFAPEMLDSERQELMQELLEMLHKVAGSSFETEHEARIHRLPDPVYPYKEMPDTLVATLYRPTRRNWFEEIQKQFGSRAVSRYLELLPFGKEVEF